MLGYAAYYTGLCMLSSQMRVVVSSASRSIPHVVHFTETDAMQLERCRCNPLLVVNVFRTQLAYKSGASSQLTDDRVLQTICTCALSHPHMCLHLLIGVRKMGTRTHKDSQKQKQLAAGCWGGTICHMVSPLECACLVLSACLCTYAYASCAGSCCPASSQKRLQHWLAFNHCVSLGRRTP
jgi:hypothetical protein